jgi:aspartate racemase
MKLLGMLGGTGPESTVDYYRLLISIYQERRPDGSYPPVLINSIDLTRLVDLVTTQDYAGLTAFLAEEIERLRRAGAEFALVAANTPHIVFDELQRAVSLPLISIVEVACQAAAWQNLMRLGLLGTRFTMQAGFYQKVFAQAGLELIVPELGEQDEIHALYMNELVKGVFRPETRRRFVDIVRRLKYEHGIEGLVLGGTELPLLLRDESRLDLPLLDTARLHVERAVDEMLA